MLGVFLVHLGAGQRNTGAAQFDRRRLRRVHALLRGRHRLPCQCGRQPRQLQQRLIAGDVDVAPAHFGQQVQLPRLSLDL